jgi:hypothetical protein
LGGEGGDDPFQQPDAGVVQMVPILAEAVQGAGQFRVLDQQGNGEAEGTGGGTASEVGARPAAAGGARPGWAAAGAVVEGGQGDTDEAGQTVAQQVA